MKNIVFKNLIKKICIIAFIIYAAVSFVKQQQTLNSYNTQKKYYAEKIQEAKSYNETLLTTIDNLDSKEYIETISREKLNMYSPNERVYININK